MVDLLNEVIEAEVSEAFEVVEVIDYTLILDNIQSSLDNFTIEVFQPSLANIQETTFYGFLMLYACVGILFGSLLIRHLRR